MTISEILIEIGELSVRGQNMQSNLKGFVNRAQRAISQRRNWSFMHDRSTATVAAAATSVDLGADFKSLSEERSPVTYTDASFGNSNVPVKVASREEVESWWPWPWPFGPVLVPIPGSYLPIRVVFIEQNGPGGNWTLNIPPQFAATAALVFNLSAYWYPAPLVAGTDHNGLTDHGDLAEALLNRTRALAYAAEDASDKRAVACLELSEAQIKSAAYSDERIKSAGRNWRI